MKYYRGVNGVVWRVENGDISTAVVWDFNSPRRWKRIKADADLLSYVEIQESEIPMHMKKGYIRTPTSCEEYRLLSEKDKLRLIKQNQRNQQRKISEER